jgi:hypothetical protein
LFVAAAVGALAAPAMAEEVGVGVGTVGEHRDIDRDRDRTTVIKEREPSEKALATTISQTTAHPAAFALVLLYAPA